MSVQFILPLLHENHPAFSQAQIRAFMTSLPQIQPHPTQHMSTLQHAYFISNMLIQ